MVDKTHGYKLGAVSLTQGQDVPYGQVEPRSVCQSGKSDSQELSSQISLKDVNGNKLDSRSLVAKLVSSLVNTLDKNYQWSDSQKYSLEEKVKEFLFKEIESFEKPLSMNKKPGPSRLNFKTKAPGPGECKIFPDENVTSVYYLSPPDSGGGRVRVNIKREVEKYLRATGNKDLDGEDFVFRRQLLGLPSKFESTIISRTSSYYKSDHSVESFQKPFQLGWLRQVRIRARDNFVTSVGTRLRFGLKKDIDEFLNKTGNKDLVVDDFVIMRRFLGVSSKFEKVTYSCQAAAHENIRDSSENPYYATVDDDTDSSDDSSSDCSDSIVPVSDSDCNNSGFQITPKNISGSIMNCHTPYSIGSQQNVGTFSPTSLFEEDTSSPDLSSAAAFRSPLASFTASQNSLPAGIPSSPPIKQHTADPVPTATMFMFSTDPSNREGGRRQKKMKIKCAVKMIKGMKAFGTSFGLNFEQLKFFVNDVQLTGEEMAGELNGARIRVEGMD